MKNLDYKANRNILFKDLLSPKYRMRKVIKKTSYNRKIEKQKVITELNEYKRV